LFVNLAFSLDSSLELNFRDYNFSYFLEQLRKVPESDIGAMLREKFRGGKDWDDLGAIIEFILSEGVCDSYLRDAKGVPATGRDFYLSKLCQFIVLSIDAAIGDDYETQARPHSLRYVIEEALDAIPNALLPDLHGLDLWQFQHEIGFVNGRPRPLAEIDSALTRLLGSYLPRYEELSEDQTDVAKQLSDRRRNLLSTYKTITGGSAVAIYNHADVKVDKSDFYAWLRGELPDSSVMTQKIEKRIHAVLKERHRR
jgi:hypothetical protein